MKSIYVRIVEALSLITLAIKRVINLTWQIITQWFENWWIQNHSIPEEEKDNIIFTIEQALKNGDYRVIQGVFNRRTAKVDGIQYEAETVDEKLQEYHRDKKLVIYDDTGDLLI